MDNSHNLLEAIVEQRKQEKEIKANEMLDLMMQGGVRHSSDIRDYTRTQLQVQLINWILNPKLDGHILADIASSVYRHCGGQIGWFNYLDADEDKDDLFEFSR